MAKKSKLLQALDREKGVDYKKQHQKKLQKEAEKKKKSKQAKSDELTDDEEVDAEEVAVKKSAVKTKSPTVKSNGKELNGHAEDGWETEDSEEDEEEDEDDDEEGGAMIDLSRLEDDSLSDDDDEDDDEDEIDEDAEGQEDEDDIPLSDIESLASEDKGDIIPHQRLTINNTTALLKAHKSIALPVSKLPFSVHQSVTSAEPTSIPDIEDELNRELAFYTQSLAAVKEARSLLKSEGVSFSRPVDYFAEMVKSDEHMGRVKQKLVDAAAGKKAAAEARRQRDLKKFGKQVQVAKEQERAKAKRDTIDKINTLKRKRQGAALTNDNEEDLFDVALEDAATTEKKDRAARRASGNGKPNPKRQKRDEKYGFGGKKRFAKSNDASSSADMRGSSTRKMKGQTKGGQRLGKSRRTKKF